MQSNRWAAVAALAALAAAGIAHASHWVEPVHVKVLPSYYVVGDRRFADVVALEAFVRPLRGAVVALDVCGRASTPRLLAAIERLHASDAASLEIRMAARGDAGCATAQPMRRPPLPRADAEYRATDRRGRSVMP